MGEGLRCVVVAALAALASVAQIAYIPIGGPGTLVTVSLGKGAVLGPPIPVGSQPIGVAVTPDGSKVYVTNSGDRTVSIIAPQTGANKRISVGETPYGIAASPDGRWIYVAVLRANVVVPIDTTNDVAGTPVTVGTHPNGIAVSPDGSKLYVTNTDENSVSVLTANNGVLSAAPIKIPVGYGPLGVAFSPNRASAYVANTVAGTVSIIDAATNKVRGNAIPVGVYPFGIAVSPDSSKVYVATRTALAVIDATANPPRLAKTVDLGVAGLIGVAFTPDGSRAVVTNNGTGPIIIVDTATDKPIKTTPPLTLGIGPRAFGSFIQQPALNADSVVPTSGSGFSNTFGAVVRDSAGWSDAGATLSFSSGAPAIANSCTIAYSNGFLSILQDSGRTWSPSIPITGGGTVSNSQCGVRAAGVHVTGTGNQANANFAVDFYSSFGGPKTSWLQATSAMGGSSQWTNRGAWTVPITVTADSVGGINPRSAAQSIVTYVSSTGGPQSIASSSLSISTGAPGAARSCTVSYSAVNGSFTLMNDAGTGPVSGSVRAGSGTVRNSQCSLSGVGSATSTSGNTLSVRYAITFLAFPGTKTLWLQATGVGGESSGWQNKGSF